MTNFTVRSTLYCLERPENPRQFHIYTTHQQELTQSRAVQEWHPGDIEYGTVLGTRDDKRGRSIPIRNNGCSGGRFTRSRIVGTVWEADPFSRLGDAYRTPQHVRRPLLGHSRNNTRGLTATVAP